MKTRKQGALEVSAIGMGCMGMSHAAGTPMNMDDAFKFDIARTINQPSQLYPHHRAAAHKAGFTA